jgi:hypothetical protein
MAQDPFAGANGSPDGDPFDAPAEIPSEYPKLVDMWERLLMVQPTKYEQGIASSFRNQDGTVQLQNRMTANVYVIDGGPVGTFTVSSFSAMYISNGRLVDQLMKAYKGQSMVLGRLDTKDGKAKTGTPKKAGAGNPWGFQDPTEEDKALARAYIAAGYRQPGEGPDGFAPTAPAGMPAGAPPAPPWSQQGSAPAPANWGPPVPDQTPPNWGQPAAPAPTPPWGQPQPAAAAPAPNPWG